MADSRLIKKLYGEDQDGEIAQSLPLLYELSKTTPSPAETHGDQSGAPAFKGKLFAMIDAQVEHLTEREKKLETEE